MKAVVVSGAGGPESLTIGQIPDPTAGAGEVLIDVAATAVNRADLMQRDGHYPPPQGASDILGLEVSGHVAAVGDGVTAWRVGDPVMALLAGGGYAELVAVPAGQVMPIPAGIDVVSAAALPEVFLTAYLTLVELGGLHTGDVALIHAASSGVGTAAIQITQAVGARAIATSRHSGRLDTPRALGAECIVVHDDGHFADAVVQLTDGHGADVVLDLVGAAYFVQNIASTARGGRIILTGLVGGRRTQVDLGELLSRNISVIGSTLRGRTLTEKAGLVSRFTRWAHPRFDDGTLRPIIDSVLPIDQVGDAHRRVGANQAVGKVLLQL